MPPDVFLALASSGLTLVASWMYFLKPAVTALKFEPEVTFCGPPLRGSLAPFAQVQLSARTSLEMSLKGDHWLFTYVTRPLADSADAPQTTVVQILKQARD
jgi:hypothetical protein